MTKRKQPLRINAPAAKKSVPAKATDVPEAEGLFRIRFGKLDLDGPWCLTKAPDDLRMVLRAVQSFETMRLHEVFGGGYPGKDYLARDLPAHDARTRLVELQLDDHERISRLRIGNMGRLYGFRHGLDFWVLWWDSRHAIWPSAN